MKSNIIILSLIFSSHILFGQNKTLKSLHDVQSYNKIMEMSNQFENSSNLDAYFIGNAFYNNAKYKEAGLWYSKIKDTIFYSDIDLYARIINSCKAINNYKCIQQNEKAYSVLSKNKLSKVSSQNNFIYNSIKIDLLNSEFSEYAPRLFENTLYFSSTRNKRKSSEKKDNWTNQNYSNLYTAQVGKFMNVEDVNEFKGMGDVTYNESSPTFTKDGKIVYFTRNNINKGKVGTDQNKNVLLKIYRAKVIDNKWTEIEDLSINDDNFNCAHPFLSKDDKTLYFSSDRPGGFGQSDLYEVKINENGTLGDVVNLGPNVNSGSRETQPFIDSKNNLYFSSDRVQGFGGMDIYVSEYNNKFFTTPKNLGESINTSMDEIGYVESANGKFGFYASNRNSNSGDDIFIFNKIETNTLTIENSENDLKSIQITALDINQKKLDPNSFTIENTTLYLSKQIKFVRFFKEGIFDTTINVMAANGQISLNKTSEAKEKTLIKTIIFPSKNQLLTEKIKKELTEITSTLIKDDTKNILIQSHSDSRGDAASNLKLTEDRANIIRKYFIENGIESKRIEVQALGDTKLTNNCKKGVNCTEKQHQRNSRVEFLVF
jgi:outer membrane protein OmpA-like peptidoglycan-associated protein